MLSLSSSRVGGERAVPRCLDMPADCCRDCSSITLPAERDLSAADAADAAAPSVAAETDKHAQQQGGTIDLPL